VVGGLDDASAAAAIGLWTRAGVGARRVSSLEAAEVCGAVAPLVRSIQTAAANELKVACARMGVDVWEVIGASGQRSLTPTCSADDPAALLVWGARRWGASFRLFECAVEINSGMSAFLISELSDVLNDRGKAVRGSKIAILGIAHTKDTNTLDRSPSLELMDLLRRKGALVSYNDPHIPSLLHVPHGPPLEPIHSQPLTAEDLSEQDCVLIAMDHSAYDYDFIVRHSKLVIDTRNATQYVTCQREKIVRC
jgi:UDP-N-acetyl-D-glucosamine dehydrogenase